MYISPNFAKYIFVLQSFLYNNIITLHNIITRLHDKEKAYIILVSP